MAGVRTSRMRMAFAIVSQSNSRAMRLGGSGKVGRAAQESHGDIQPNGTMGWGRVPSKSAKSSLAVSRCGVLLGSVPVLMPTRAEMQLRASSETGIETTTEHSIKRGCPPGATPCINERECKRTTHPALALNQIHGWFWDDTGENRHAGDDVKVCHNRVTQNTSLLHARIAEVHLRLNTRTLKIVNRVPMPLVRTV
jgi:hypothetical protein